MNYIVLSKNKKFITGAIVAIIVAAIFTFAYFNNRKIPSSGNAEIINSDTEQSENQKNNEGAIIGEQQPETELPIDPSKLATTTAGQDSTILELATAAIDTNDAVTQSSAKPMVTPKISPEGAAIRDEQRQTDMRRLAGAQVTWHGDHKRYYTCSATSGDCSGKINNMPSIIGTAAKDVVDPLNNGRNCGRDYTYCGLDNTRDSSKFCYYAKLESGGYYVVSENGSYRRDTVPSNLDGCSALAVSKSVLSSETIMTTVKERDAQRKLAMAQLFAAQSSWYKIKGKYYTCSAEGGDCQGKPVNYPGTLDFAMAKTPVDPVNAGTVCGVSLIYCGLDNTRDNAKFCYYAKLESGGYYTASNNGNFERATPPATFGECNQPI